MRTFLLLLSAVLISASATANESKRVLQVRNESHASIQQQRCKIDAMPQQVLDTKAIIDTPAGKLLDNLTLSEFALYPRGFEIYQRMVSGQVSAIVEGDDGCLYVKNPISVYKTDSWLKLEHREGSTYVAKLPQTATEPWDYEGENICMNFDRLDFDEDEGYYYPSFTESELTFNYENGVLTSVGEIGEDDEMPVMLGLTFDIYGPDDADEAWAWYGVNNITVKAMDVSPVELPAGVSADKKVMVSTDGESLAWVAVSDDKVYLRTSDKLGYAVGTIADGKATFESGQYVGIAGDSHCFFYGGTSEFIEDEDYDEGGYTVYRIADNITFDYLTDGTLLKSDNVLLINVGNLSLSAKDVYNKPVIQDYATVEAAPKNPVIVRYDGYDDFDEFGVFVFELPVEATNGESISKVDIYYNIFAENSDQPYVFSPSMYELIGSPMTNIPYDFTDGGFDFSVKDTRHTIVLYDEIERVGVQSVNVAGDKEYKSQIVWSDDEQAGIESIISDQQGECQLFDLMGRPVNNPANGIYIRRQGKHIEKVVVK